MATSPSTPITDPDRRLGVVVGILVGPDGYLVQQRPPGKPCAGYWEFPGGKIEPGETPEQALDRELHEELAVRVVQSRFLMEHLHDYDHANVRLLVYLVTRFEGAPVPIEGQNLLWGSLDQIRSMEVLEAVYPILERMAEN